MPANARPPPCPDNDRPFLFRRSPRASLTGMVTDIVGYRENGHALAGQVEMATLVVPLIISFGAPFSIALGRQPTPADAYASFTSGLFPGPVRIDSSGAAECLQIDLTPLGAYRFFGFPMSEIAGRMVTLGELGDPTITALQQRLGDEQDWARRLDLAEDFVAKRLCRASGADPAVDRAYRQILASRGTMRIEHIAAELDWSRKHLSQRFRARTGVGPKVIARMVRFQGVLAMARAASPDWAGIAAECGYADQAHLTRDFREFAGTSPARWHMNMSAASR